MIRVKRSKRANYPEVMNFGMIGAGLVMGIAAIGSAIGIAGQGAIGAWKRCFMANKPAPFILTVFAGAPLTLAFLRLPLDVADGWLFKNR